MKFIYACDVHGDKNKYNKLIELCKETGINTIVLGGDIILKIGDRKKEQPIYLKEVIDPYFAKLQENNINCICIMGNDDLEVLDEEYERICNKYSNVYNVDNSSIIFEDICFIGCGKVLDGHCKSDYNMAQNKTIIDGDEEKEKRADKFALDVMIEEDIWKEIIKDIDEENLKTLSKKYKIAMSFIVGRLAKNNYISYTSKLYNKYKIV